MKKIKKQILGLIGLILVAAVTVFAAFLPRPDALAVDAGSVTDTITVRVVGDVPNIDVNDVKSNSLVTNPNQSLTVNYENTFNITITLEYTDEDNVKHIYTIDSTSSDGTPGSKVVNLDLQDPNYGYGEYVITVRGEGAGGVYDEDKIEFSFIPTNVEIKHDEKDDSTYLDLTHNNKDEDIKKIKINIYDEDGNLVEDISPIVVDPTTDRVEIPPKGHDLKPGDYVAEIITLDGNGNMIYLPRYIHFSYNGSKIVPVPVPNTGGMLRNLNISKEDTLITSVLIFLLAAIFGFVFIAKRKTYKKSYYRRKR